MKATSTLAQGPQSRWRGDVESSIERRDHCGRGGASGDGLPGAIGIEPTDRRDRMSRELTRPRQRIQTRAGIRPDLGVGPEDRAEPDVVDGRGRGSTDLSQIVRRSAAVLGCKIDEGGVAQIARRSRGTARIANRLLRRVRDFAEVRADGILTAPVADAALAQLDIDSLGLDQMDRELMGAMAHRFDGGPVGLETLAAAISEESDTIMDVYEPYLLKLGFLMRTPRGRVLTPAGYAHLGLDPEARIAQVALFGLGNDDSQ